MEVQPTEGERPLDLEAAQGGNEEAILGERLRFERLVSDLSAKFLIVGTEQLDAEIEHSLKMILEFFKVDRCGLLQILPSKGVWMITHSALSEHVAPVPAGIQLPISIHPWAYDKLIKKREEIVYSKIEDVPPEAEVDKKTWSEWGIRSNLVIPILIRDEVTHAIAINSVNRERVWPGDIIPRLQLLGEIFVNSLERKHVQLQLEQALKFQEMLSVLSARFVNLPSDRVDAEIENGLQRIARLLGLDRCVMACLSEDKSQVIPSHSWGAYGVEPAISVEQGGTLPWVVSKIMRAEPAIIPSVDELPEEAAKDKEFFEQVGARSGLYLPLTADGEILGILSFVSLHAEKVWSEELVRGLQVVADVFSNMLIRRQKDRAIHAREKDLQSLTGRLILAQEEERRRLARELHDDLVQRLAVLAIEAGKAEMSVKDERDPALRNLRNLRDGAIQISADVHAISRRLHPSILNDLGLVKAVESECSQFSNREGIDVDFEARNVPKGLPADVALSIYRIVQESLTNIAKHACARRVTVSLSASEAELHLCIRDDGLGFDAAEERKMPGLGLSSIRERVRLVNGRHRVCSEPEKGTTIDVTVPLQPKAPIEEYGVLSEGLA